MRIIDHGQKPWVLSENLTFGHGRFEFGDSSVIIVPAQDRPVFSFSGLGDYRLQRYEIHTVSNGGGANLRCGMADPAFCDGFMCKANKACFALFLDNIFLCVTSLINVAVASAQDLVGMFDSSLLRGDDLQVYDYQRFFVMFRDVVLAPAA